MRLDPDPNFGLLLASGRDAPLLLKLTKQERATLANALVICERAADLIGDDEHPYHQAASWLYEALNP